jgi:AcrR family transcriptional regulator
VVTGSQRRRILDAIVELVAGGGYARTTVGGIAAAAGVSRSTFYEQFDSKLDCFSAAYEDVASAAIAAIVTAAAAAGDDPRARLGAGIDAYLAWCSEHPAAATTFIVEVHTAGAAALAQRAEIMRRFCQVIVDAAPDVHPAAVTAVIAAIDSMAHECIRKGRAERLTEVAADARFVAERLLG